MAGFLARIIRVSTGLFYAGTAPFFPSKEKRFFVMYIFNETVISG